MDASDEDDDDYDSALDDEVDARGGHRVLEIARVDGEPTLSAVRALPDRKRIRIPESEPCAIMQDSQIFVDMFSGSALHATVSKRIKAAAKRYSTQLKKVVVDHQAEVMKMQQEKQCLLVELRNVQHEHQKMMTSLNEQREIINALKLELMTCSNEVRVYEVLFGSIRKMTEIK